MRESRGTTRGFGGFAIDLIHTPDTIDSKWPRGRPKKRRSELIFTNLELRPRVE